MNQISSSTSSILLKFSPERAKKLCKLSFDSLNRIILNSKFNESQIKWFFPTFKYCFTLNRDEDSDLFSKAYEISLNWILKNNGNFDKKLYLSLFPEILLIFSSLFENKSVESNYLTIISDICPFITNPIFELDSNCYFTASHFLNFLLEKVTQDEQRIQIIYAAIEVLPHYYVNYSYSLQQMEKIRGIVKSMEMFSFEWENIIKQIVFKFCKELVQCNLQENDKMAFLSIQKLCNFDEIITPMYEFFKNYSNDRSIKKKEGLYSLRIPHNLILELMCDKLLMEPIETVLNSINKLLLESDLDENSKWLKFLMNVVISRCIEDFNLSITTMNLFLVKFPFKSIHFVFIFLKKMRENLKLIQNVTTSWQSLMFNFSIVINYICSKINKNINEKDLKQQENKEQSDKSFKEFENNENESEIQQESDKTQKQKEDDDEEQADEDNNEISNIQKDNKFFYEQKMFRSYLPVFSMNFFGDRLEDVFFICYSLSKTGCISSLLEEMTTKQTSNAVSLFIFYLSEFSTSFFKLIPSTSWFDNFFGALKTKFSEQNLLIYKSLCSNIILPPLLQDQVKASIFKTRHALLMQTLRQTLREENLSSFREKLEKAIPFASGPTIDLLKDALSQEISQAKISIKTLLINLENSGLSLLLNMLKYLLNSQPLHLLNSNDINQLTDFKNKRVCHIRAGNSILSFVEKDSNSFNLIVRNIAGLFAYEIQDCNENSQTSNKNILKRTLSFFVQNYALPPSTFPQISPSSFLFGANQAKYEKENDFGKLAFVPANEITALDSIIRSPYVDVIVYDINFETNELFKNSSTISNNCKEMMNYIGFKADHIMNSEGKEVYLKRDSNVRIIRTKLIDTYFIYFSDSLLKDSQTSTIPKFAIFFCEKRPLAIDITKIGVSMLFLVRKVDCFYSLEVITAAKLYGIKSSKLLLPKNELGNIITLYIHSYFFENDNNIFLQQIQLRWNFISSIKQKYQSTTTDLLQNFFL